MTTSTEYFTGEESTDYYAKPRPQSDTPSWGEDAIVLDEGLAGEYSFTRDDSLEYVIYEQAGESPAATDEPVWNVRVQVTLAQQIEIITKLTTLQAVFDGIDKLIKWIRR